MILKYKMCSLATWSCEDVTLNGMTHLRYDCEWRWNETIWWIERQAIHCWKVLAKISMCLLIVVTQIQ